MINGRLNIVRLKAFNLSLTSKNGAEVLHFSQMIYGLKSLKLFHGHECVLIIMAAVSRVHGLSCLDPPTFPHRKDQYWCSKSCFFRDMLNEIGQLNIVSSEDTCVWESWPMIVIGSATLTDHIFLNAVLILIYEARVFEGAEIPLSKLYL
ncbi:hypothetical protein Tco_0777601 [Tanacetum coccineum]